MSISIQERFGTITTKQEGFHLNLNPNSPFYEITLSLTGGINWKKTMQHLTRPQGWKMNYEVELCTSGGKNTSVLIATSPEGEKAMVEIEPIAERYYKEGKFYPLAAVGEEKTCTFFQEVQKALNKAIEETEKKKKKQITQIKLNQNYAEKCKTACEKAGYEIFPSNNGIYFVKGTFQYQQKRKTRYMPNPTVEWLAQEKNLI